MTINEQIFLFFNSGHTEFLDSFLSICTAAGTWIPLYLVCAIALSCRFGWQKALIMVASIGLAVGLSDLICARLIRPYFQILRPGNLDNPFSEYVTVINNHRGGKYGFPSCHAANCFAWVVGFCIFTKDNWVKILLLLWAAFICYTRMYVGKHYPADLLAGAIIGSCIGAICSMSVKYYGNKSRFYKNSRPIVSTNSHLPQLIIYGMLAITLLTAAIYSAITTI